MAQLTLHWQSDSERGHGTFAAGTPVRLGRSRDADLPLPAGDRHIHRKHAEVEWEGGTPRLRNVGTNPIRVGERALRTGEVAALKAGDRLRIGSAEVHVMLSRDTDKVRMLQCHNCLRVQPYQPETMCVQCGYALAGADTVLVDRPDDAP